jgi:hypothetical protein
MRSGPEQRPRGRFNANRPFREQPRIPENGQTFDSTGPNIKIRGSAHQIFERYLVLAREATASGDRIAAENFYQHADHYFRINNARRETNQRGLPPRPTTPANVEMNSSDADLREVDVDRFQPQWTVMIPLPRKLQLTDHKNPRPRLIEGVSPLSDGCLEVAKARRGTRRVHGSAPDGPNSTSQSPPKDRAPEASNELGRG